MLLAATPLDPARIDRPHKIEAAHPNFPTYTGYFPDGRSLKIAFPHIIPRGRPLLRGVRFFDERQVADEDVIYSLALSERCEIDIVYGQRGEDLSSNGTPIIPTTWIVAAFVDCLNWIEQLRRQIGAGGLEFSLSVSIVSGRDVHFGEFRDQYPKSLGRLPNKITAFPGYGVRDTAEFSDLTSLFTEDLLNLVGVDLNRFPRINVNAFSS
ncbi:MAG: hypothetical protein RIF46_10795 [Cyclobacteriaceae bacterium]